MDDPIGETVELLQLAVIAILAYFGWKFYQSFADTKADNGKPKCTLSDMSNGNCLSGDGSSACGWYEYLTATTCYEGTPVAASTNPTATPPGTTQAPVTPGGGNTCWDTLTMSYYPC